MSGVSETPIDNSHRARILIIEDEPLIAEDLRAALSTLVSRSPMRRARSERRSG